MTKPKFCHSEKNIGNLIRVIDEVLQSYISNPQSIFQSYSEFIEYQFENVCRRNKVWYRKSKCMVPNCQAKAIQKSHTLPRSMSLRPIAEDGKVLTPQFNPITNSLELKEVGLAKASTFPGFCEVHERLFHEFEQNNFISNKHELYLQVYRSTCREIYRTKHVSAQFESVISKIKYLRDRRLLEKLRNILILYGMQNNFDINGLSVVEDSLFTMFEERFNNIKNHHIALSEILPTFENHLFHGQQVGTYVSAITIDIKIPVALSGSATIEINHKCYRRKLSIVMGLMPSGNRSLFFVAGRKDDHQEIENYFSYWKKNPFSMLALAETWMLNGTDQWYITPSVWRAIPEMRKKELLNIIMSYDQNIGDDLGISIFDEIRIKLLSEITCPAYVISKESSKMS